MQRLEGVKLDIRRTIDAALENGTVTGAMLDAETIAELNAHCKMPADAGPAWREAVQMGIDMTLIECNLELSP